ncbi:MAG: hypothetical protein Q9M92_07990 [Enterobacterales bacterium]|nr:hypothetical protein [Enterobacterales bacterium]
MKNWSLQKRLTLVSSIILLIAFSIIYFATQSAYSIASKSRLQESMTAQVYALMAVANDEQDNLIIPDLLRNDRLENLSSGLVAYVLTETGRLLGVHHLASYFYRRPRTIKVFLCNNLQSLIMKGVKYFG